MTNDTPPPAPLVGRILVLHGNRQTGQLLLGRMDKLRKKLVGGGMSTPSIALVAIDAPFPHPEDAAMRTWWHRSGNTYDGLEESTALVQRTWNNNNYYNSSTSTEEERSPFVGLLGFSQGARLAHLLALQHDLDPSFLPGLQFTIQVAGYDAPLPDNFACSSCNGRIRIPSLLVWGEMDRLITPQQSEAVTAFYENPVTHVHDSGHHVPMRAASVRAYLEFVQQQCYATLAAPSPSRDSAAVTTTAAAVANQPPQEQVLNERQVPEEETALQQYQEVEALQAIYPDEFHLLSKSRPDPDGGETTIYEHPISYCIDLPASDEGIWPPRPIQLHVTYPHNYPSAAGSNHDDDGSAIPALKLIHENNGMEFLSGQTAACLSMIKAAAEEEQGMPCVLTCLYAAREYFESGAMKNTTAQTGLASEVSCDDEMGDEDDYADVEEEEKSPGSPFLKPASHERIQACNLQGLEIAEQLLYGKDGAASDAAGITQENGSVATGKGGSWQFTIGLVGKPRFGVFYRKCQMVLAFYLISVSHPFHRQTVCWKINALQYGDGFCSTEAATGRGREAE